jgi:myo-inositol-1(or 4)-monophosphatase
VNAEAFALDLARRVQREVRPLLGTSGARRRAGTAHGGDPTYRIDATAEQVVAEAFEGHDDVAFFTEDEGLVVRGSPRELFLIDPIDGTRPAAAGFETCCVTVGIAPFGDGVVLGDLTYGCVVELATGGTFQARRGGGVEVEGRAVRPRRDAELRSLFWASGFRGQPAVPLTTVLQGLFDVPGSEGAFFDHGSAAYSLTRVATGQIDAYVDPGAASIEAVPQLEEAYLRIGGGHVLNTVTYDCAAGYLLLWELGLPCTDALGRPLQGVPLFDGDGRAIQTSTVAAATPKLHEELLGLVRAGLDRLHDSFEPQPEARRQRTQTP